mgnify:CR=1 FL=1
MSFGPTLTGFPSVCRTVFPGADCGGVPEQLRQRLAAHGLGQVAVEARRAELDG